MDPILISLEGNIGSGKSTLLKRLRELQPEWNFIDEPVEFWMNTRNEKGESLIEVFYKDIKRWSYTFQNAAVLSRGILIRKALKEWAGTGKSPVFVMERCVETDKYIFAKMLYADGKLDKMEWELYNMWYTFITEQIPKMNVYVWIDTEPTVCFERIKKRAREGEDDISMDYLEKLDAIHKEWLLNENSAKIVRSTDIEEICEKINKLIHSHEKAE